MRQRFINIENIIMKYEIIPSILSANFSHLIQDIKNVEKTSISMLHIDVMDGHFVPPITIGHLVVDAIREKTNLFFDTHLMVSHPQKHIQFFAEAGSDGLTVHVESKDNLPDVISSIKSYGKKVGLSEAMPDWGESFDDDGIRSIVQYIRQELCKC